MPSQGDRPPPSTCVLGVLGLALAGALEARKLRSEDWRSLSTRTPSAAWLPPCTVNERGKGERKRERRGCDTILQKLCAICVGQHARATRSHRLYKLPVILVLLDNSNSRIVATGYITCKPRGCYCTLASWHVAIQATALLAQQNIMCDLWLIHIVPAAQPWVTWAHNQAHATCEVAWRCARNASTSCTRLSLLSTQPSRYNWPPTSCRRSEYALKMRDTQVITSRPLDQPGAAISCNRTAQSAGWQCYCRPGSGIANFDSM